MRFTTYERLQPFSIFVINKDGRREEFRREKLLTGIRKACEKRSLESGAVDKLVDEIEGELYQTGKAEIPGAAIGDMVMAKLKKLDHIAYIRFASVYRDFADITELKQEVDSLAGHATAPPADQLPLIPLEVLPAVVKTKRRVRR
jgi:transcriptional repressor NrdR